MDLFGSIVSTARYKCAVVRDPVLPDFPASVRRPICSSGLQPFLDRGGGWHAGSPERKERAAAVDMGNASWKVLSLPRFALHDSSCEAAVRMHESCATFGACLERLGVAAPNGSRSSACVVVAPLHRRPPRRGQPAAGCGGGRPGSAGDAASESGNEAKVKNALTGRWQSLLLAGFVQVSGFLHNSTALLPSTCSSVYSVADQNLSDRVCRVEEFGEDEGEGVQRAGGRKPFLRRCLGPKRASALASPSLGWELEHLDCTGHTQSTVHTVLSYVQYRPRAGSSK